MTCPSVKPCFMFHYWGNWSDPFLVSYHVVKRSFATEQAFDLVQDRTCRTCGKVERRVISKGAQ